MVFLGFCWRISRQPTSRSAAVRRYIYHQRHFFKQWAERLQEYAQSAELQQDYWLERAKTGRSLARRLFWGENTVAAANTVSVSLNQKETQALLQVPKAYNTQINDVLLTALVQAFAEWTGERTLLDQEGHGREDVFDVDLSRTIGWFTTIFPVVLELEEASHPSDALKAVKDQLRIPNRGLGYGAPLSEQRRGTLAAIPQARCSTTWVSLTRYSNRRCLHQPKSLAGQPQSTEAAAIC